MRVIFMMLPCRVLGVRAWRDPLIWRSSARSTPSWAKAVPTPPPRGKLRRWDPWSGRWWNLERTAGAASSRVPGPPPDLLNRRLLAVHEDTYPVDAGADPDHARYEGQGQDVRQGELLDRRHLESDAQR